MKICSRCNEQKTLALYPKAPTCVDGHRSYCKACDKARKNIWRASNKTAHNEKSRKWARANPEKRKAVQDTYNAMYRASGRALVCGLHVANNLQVISAKENYEKSNLFNNTRSR